MARKKKASNKQRNNQNEILDQVKEMFPSVPHGSIAEIYHKCGGSMEEIVNQLLVYDQGDSTVPASFSHKDEHSRALDNLINNTLNHQAGNRLAERRLSHFMSILAAMSDGDLKKSLMNLKTEDILDYILGKISDDIILSKIGYSCNYQERGSKFEVAISETGIGHNIFMSEEAIRDIEELINMFPEIEPDVMFGVYRNSDSMLDSKKTLYNIELDNRVAIILQKEPDMRVKKAREKAKKTIGKKIIPRDVPNIPLSYSQVAKYGMGDSRELFKISPESLPNDNSNENDGWTKVVRKTKKQEQMRVCDSDLERYCKRADSMLKDAICFLNSAIDRETSQKIVSSNRYISKLLINKCLDSLKLCEIYRQIEGGVYEPALSENENGIVLDLHKFTVGESLVVVDYVLEKRDASKENHKPILVIFGTGACRKQPSRIRSILRYHVSSAGYKIHEADNTGYFYILSKKKNSGRL